MSKLKVDTLADSTDSSSTPIADVINGSARAWANISGEGTVTLRDSYNVSSVTDNGVGDYQLNFETPMPDDNYSATATTVGAAFASILSPNLNSVRAYTRANSDGDAIDRGSIYVTIHGN